MPKSPRLHRPTPSDFAYSREQFRELVEACLATAKTLGASDAVAEVSEGVGLSVSVRKGETENIERNRDKSISVTVYVGQRRGNASTSDFSRAALEQTVRAAHDIARFTAEDPAAGLPDEADLADGEAVAARPRPVPSLGDRRRAGDRARHALRSRRARGRPAHHQLRRRRRLGAAVALLRRQHARLRRRLRELAPLAVGGADRLAARPVGRRHAARRLVHVDARRRTSSPRRRRSGATPPSARSRGWRRARSGPARCRCCSSRRSRRACSAPTCRRRAAARSTASRPSCSTASASACCPSTSTSARIRTCARQGQRAVRRRRRGDEGGATSSTAGVVGSYFLSTYSARKLGMRTTGHAGGSHNLALTLATDAAGRRSRGDARQARSRPLRDRADGAGRELRHRRLLARRGRLLGRERQDRLSRCTRSPSPATCARCSGGIAAVGADAYTMGSKTIGSVLIERMKIAGA